MRRRPDAPGSRTLLKEWTKALLVAIVLWLLVRTFVIEAYRIPSGSMEATLLDGDFLFVNKAIYGAEVPFLGFRLPAWREPRRGDVLVFDSVEEPGKRVVKRLVGLPGDTLEMRGGTLYVNRVAAPEPYARHESLDKSVSPESRLKMRAWQLRHLVGRDSASYDPDLQDWGPLLVPPDSLFVLGDNRENSYDGRYWGFVPRNHVRGTPLVIYFSYDPTAGRLPFLTAVRLRRMFTVPR